MEIGAWDLIESVFRGVLFCIFGGLLFVAGVRSIIIRDHHFYGNFATFGTGGLIFICLGTSCFILGGMLVYGVCSGRFPVNKTPDDLDGETEKLWFGIFMIAMMFLSISGLLTIVWGTLGIVASPDEVMRVLNMLMVSIVGFLIFILPIVLFKVLSRPSSSMPSMSQISPKC